MTELSNDIVVCHDCGHTEDIRTARKRWARHYVGGRQAGWTCDECWCRDDALGLTPEELE